MNASRSFREEKYGEAALCFHSAGQPDREAQCYLDDHKPRKAAEIWADSTDPRHLRKAADLYLELNSEAQAVLCYRRLFGMGVEVADQNDLLQLCAEYYEKGKKWDAAGDMWQELNCLNRALDCYLRVACHAELGKVYELLAKEAEQLTMMYEHREHALSHFKRAKRWEDGIRVATEMRAWKECAEICSEQQRYAEAAEFYQKAGLWHEAVECLLLAQDFPAAWKTLPKLNGSAPSLEIKCLAALGRYNEAAIKQMQQLPPKTGQGDEHPGAIEQRQELVRSAFDLAQQDARTWPRFLADYKHEMPDRATTLMFFLEIGATKELVDDFLEKGDVVSAAAVASLSGEPDRAVEILQEALQKWSVSPDDRMQLRSYLLESLHIAALCAGTGKSRGPSAKLQAAFDLLRGHVPAAKLEFIKYLLAKPRAAKQTGGKTLLKNLKQLKEVYQKAEMKSLSEAMKFQIEQELVLAEDAEWKDVSKLLMLVSKIASSEQVLDDCYCARPRLHWHFTQTMERICRDVGKRFQKNTSTILVPAQHPLASSGTACKAFHKAVELLQGAAAIQDDFLDREVWLLERLSALTAEETELASKKEAARCWQTAAAKAQAGPEVPRLDRLQQGLEDAMVQLCIVTRGMNKTLSKMELLWLQGVPKRYWRRSVDAAAASLGVGGPLAQRQQDLQKLKEAVITLVKMHRVQEGEEHNGKDDAWVMSQVADIVMDDLPILKPVCPSKVEHYQCKQRRCPCDHPRVDHATPSGFLLASEDRRSKFPQLLGIGLPAFLDMTSICFYDLYRGCRWKDSCPLHHLERSLAKKLKAEVKDMELHMHLEQYAKLAPSLIRHRAEQVKDKDLSHQVLPEGFGYLFFEDADKARNVRVVSILCHAFETAMPKASCKALLLRMCRAIYRYPDPLAAQHVREALTSVHKKDPDAFLDLSKTISAEVDGGTSSRCLLSSVLSLKKAEPGTKTILQRDSKTQKQTAYPSSTRTWVAKERSSTGEMVNQWDKIKGTELFPAPQGDRGGQSGTSSQQWPPGSWCNSHCGEQWSSSASSWQEPQPEGSQTWQRGAKGKGNG